nr:Sua5/YciO/YrdC/YwlC family protein [Francisella adeliensis]
MSVKSIKYKLLHRLTLISTIMLTRNITTIINELKNNNVVSIPTDTVYGLSCLIKQSSVEKIINLKNRDSSKGFIIISHDFNHINKYIDIEKLTNEQLKLIQIPISTPTTWIVPAKSEFFWLTGGRPTVAIRIVKTKTVEKICSSLNCAIISTSANLSGEEFINNSVFINKIFKDILVLKTPVSQTKPSNIINLITGEKIR